MASPDMRLRADSFPTDAGAAFSTAGEPRLDRKMQARIGVHLRALYDDLAEPVPDRLADLIGHLQRLEKEKR